MTQTTPTQVWITNLFTNVPIFAKDKNNPPKCPVCEITLPNTLEWTVVHGVAQCRCSAQFQTLHYKDNKVLDQEPTCLVPADLIPKYNEAWKSQNINGRDLFYEYDSEQEKLNRFFKKVERINKEHDKGE